MGEMRPVILIVEDDEKISEMYKERFEREKFIVATERYGDMAIKRFAQEKPDIVLLDIMLPGRDGIEILQIMKSNPTYHDIPVIMLTAYPKDEFKRLAKNAGIVHFLSKSETMPGEVVEKVKETIGWKK